MAFDSPTPPLSASERLDRLRLIRSENVGPITFHRLLQHFGNASAALAAVPELARRGGRSKPIVLCPKSAAEREIERHEAIGARLLVWGDADYPARLAAIDDAPPVLSVLGSVPLLGKPAVAMVGARNASLNGRNFARRLAAELGQAGLTVVSGLALGVDAAAHEGSLATGTVAVLAGGVDHIYPRENGGLYEKIAETGTVVAEHPPGTVPQASFFPRRNRIISGLSLGVVVVEASLRSGSLITARQALDQGREVFAVPGSPLDPRARGPNDLLRNGAALVESADDVLAVLGDMLRRPLLDPRGTRFRPHPPPPPAEAEVENARPVVRECLSPTPVLVDEIIRRCQLSPAAVSTVLLELELAGQLQRHPGNQVSLIHPG